MQKMRKMMRFLPKTQEQIVLGWQKVGGSPAGIV